MQGLAELNRLKGLNPLKLRDFEKVLQILSGTQGSIPEAGLFNFVKNYVSDFPETYEQFNALSVSEQSIKLKKSLVPMETQFNQYLSSLTMEYQFPSRRYIYSFNGSGTNLRFNTSLPYDSGKPWYEQEGGYDFQNTSVPHPAPTGTIMFIYFRVNKSGSNTYSAYIAVHKADGSGHSPQCDNRSSQAPFTPPNSPVTATLVEDGNPSNQLSIEIKDIDDAGDGTMSANIKIDSGVFESYTLKFRGNSLPLY